ncbi:peptidylprolyl isomerase [Methanofervidicoccus abyssi]|uniref:Peptidyl-prolyl cis-trans isomerase n=1 Tax=Methanofervidicoccus abyssi TaxID=2082189 RepID=A0A401HRY9_9EURY|nr:peptidylprolyl isomerase [Methanofervidicoccus abyssi]GBF36901.1 FKBP-type peptidyl-prolyl cis-trans isomerase SlyD [Methanofervidicoccus abyssi]
MEKGAIVKVSYSGYVDGKLFDTTNEELAKEEGIYNPGIRYGPITVIVGQGMLIPGLDEALLEMEVGEEKELELPPEKAFGKRDPSKIRLVPLREFKKHKINPVVGMPVTINNLVGRVVSINGGRVLVDFNHELAGKTVKYILKVEEVVEKPEDVVKELLKLFIPRLNMEEIKVEVREKEVNITIPGEMLIPLRDIGVLIKVVADEILKRLDIEKVSFIEEFKRKDEKSQ